MSSWMASKQYSTNAEENIGLPLSIAGEKPDKAWVDDLLQQIGLSDRRKHRPAELSGGEHQRLAISRALVNDPAILLTDEPTGNLDTVTAGEIIDILMAYVQSHGTTLILVTHDEELAGRCADRILRMKDGQLIA